jgi:hypothetical protein
MTPRHQRNLTRRKMLFALGGAAVAVPAIAAVAPLALAGQTRPWGPAEQPVTLST